MGTNSFANFHPDFEALLGADPRGLLAKVTEEEVLLFTQKINYKFPGGKGLKAYLRQACQGSADMVDRKRLNTSQCMNSRFFCFYAGRMTCTLRRA